MAIRRRSIAPPARMAPALPILRATTMPIRRRWFQVVLTLDRVGTSSALAGTNHLDIAVSQTRRPHRRLDNLPLAGAEQRHGGHPGPWLRRRILPGRLSTHRRRCPRHLPDHQRVRAVRCRFLRRADLRHLQAGAGFRSMCRQCGAVQRGRSKCSCTGVHRVAGGLLGGAHAGAHGGTEYLLSSDAVFYNSGTSDTIWLWAVSNTKAIDHAPGPP